MLKRWSPLQLLGVLLLSALLLGVLLFSLSVPGFSAPLEVNSAWARATPAGARVGAVYMDLFNPGNVAETIVQVETAVARTAQIHRTINVDGMLKMRSAMPLTIGAGQGVSLAPAGMHMMLMGLSQPLVVGSSFNVTLVLQSGEALTVEVKVGSPGQLVAP